MKKRNRIKKKNNWKVFLFSALVVFVLVGGLGSLFTSLSTDTVWYHLIKPAITPPNWVFPIVWNFLFVLITFSLYFAWINSKNKKQKIQVALLFGINFILNILWTFLFFGLRQPKLALFEIALLWLSILAVILGVNKISRKSSWLLVPYLVWVAFASILNYLAVIGF